MTEGAAGRRPPARGLPLIVDASVAVQWFANEPGSEAAARLIEEDQPLVAPDIMPVEAANAWWKKVRRHEMDAADLEQALTGLLALGVALAPTAPLLRRAGRLAVQIGHPVYDCVYIVLAGDEGARLATVDARLRRAAARTGVRVWRP